MVKWFMNLDVSDKIAIIIPVGLAIISALFAFLKLFLKKNKKVITEKTQTSNVVVNNITESINKNSQIGNDNIAGKIEGNKNIIAGGDVHAGVSEDLLKDAIKALNKALVIIDTNQSKKLASEIEEIPDDKLSASIVYKKNQIDNRQKLNLKTEFEIYGELWKSLTDLKDNIIITPTLDITPRDKNLFEVYNERLENAIDAFNIINKIIQYNRPFFHADVYKITKDFLSPCRSYIAKVKRVLNSEYFDDSLHDEADELLGTIPKAVDEIEKAIKIRIGLLEKPKIDNDMSIGSGLKTNAQIIKGSITYNSNSLNYKPLIGLNMSIVGGNINLNEYGELEANVRTEVPFQPLQKLNEKLGLNSMTLVSQSNTISTDKDNPTEFKSSKSSILPQGENTLNLSTWEEVPIPISIHVDTQTIALGYLKSKVFQGTFKAILTYHELKLEVTMDGTFQAHLNNYI